MDLKKLLESIPRSITHEEVKKEEPVALEII